MSKPSLFVGSSTEGLEFARAVRSLLVHDAEVTVWNEGFFTVGGTFIDSLVNALPRFDFAAVVLTPDDMVTSRDVAVFGPRDNAVFELGLFMGRLGRSRTFVVRPSGSDLKLPSDLAGLTTAAYDWPRADGNYQAAVGAACDSIRGEIRRLGFIETRLTQQVRAVQDEQERQRGDIDGILRFLIQSFVTEHELIHLKKLGDGQPFPFIRSDTFEAELRRLVSLRLIERKPGRGFRSLFKANDDVNNHMAIADRGRAYLAYVRQVAQNRGDGSDAA
jgi:predicted nucleotide-binding protein with TIR-like domain